MGEIMFVPGAKKLRLRDVESVVQNARSVNRIVWDGAVADLTIVREYKP